LQHEKGTTKRLIDHLKECIKECIQINDGTSIILTKIDPFNKRKKAIKP